MSLEEEIREAFANVEYPGDDRLTVYDPDGFIRLKRMWRGKPGKNTSRTFCASTPTPSPRSGPGRWRRRKPVVFTPTTFPFGWKTVYTLYNTRRRTLRGPALRLPHVDGADDAIHLEVGPLDVGCLVVESE